MKNQHDVLNCAHGDSVLLRSLPYLLTLILMSFGCVLLIFTDRVHALEVNVDDFGAVGDGITFDHSAIKAAIDAAGEGGTVQFTAGKRYNLCNTIYPRPFQQLIGNGATLRRCDALTTTLAQDAQQGATTILVEDASRFERRMFINPVKEPGGFFDAEPAGTRHIIESVDGNLITFRNGLAQAYAAGDIVTTEFNQVLALSGQTIDSFIFDGNRSNNDVYISWAANKAIKAYNGVTIVNSVFRDLPGDGINAYGTDMLIAGNVFHDTNTAAIHLSGILAGHDGNGPDVTIRDNLMFDTNEQYQRARHSEGVITISLWPNRIRVLNNLAADAPVPFISRFHRDMGDWTIEGNKVYQTQGLFYGVGDENWLPDNPLYDVVWRSNYAEQVVRSSMERFSGGRGINFEFTGNIIANGSVVFDGLSDASIENNIIRDCSNEPMVVLNGTNVSVSNNNLDASFCENAAAVAHLFYDPTSGRVTVQSSQAESDGIARFVLANDGESMPFRVENVNLPFQDVGNNTDLGTFVIGQYDLLDSPIIGLHDLGEILPPGLQSIEQVAEYLELARFAYESGAYGQFRVIFGYLPGDLNNDYTVDNLDIDLMRDAVINMTSDSKFNVDAQGHPNVPDSNDFDFYITDPSMLGTGFGDGDLNKIVNFNDFVLIKNNFGMIGTGWNQGNYNADNNTNFNDFVLLAKNFGMSFLSGATSQAPEPSTLVLLALSGTLLMLRRQCADQSDYDAHTQALSRGNPPIRAPKSRLKIYRNADLKCTHLFLAHPFV